MPHVIVKLWPGNSEEQRQQLSDAITQNIVDILQKSEASVSVIFEEVSPTDWNEQVYQPEIKGNWDRLQKQPGYEM